MANQSVQSVQSHDTEINNQPIATPSTLQPAAKLLKECMGEFINKNIRADLHDIAQTLADGYLEAWIKWSLEDATSKHYYSNYFLTRFKNICKENGFVIQQAEDGRESN